jgi:hypothetical protein
MYVYDMRVREGWGGSPGPIFDFPCSVELMYALVGLGHPSGRGFAWTSSASGHDGRLESPGVNEMVTAQYNLLGGEGMDQVVYQNWFCFISGTAKSSKPRISESH